MQQKIGYISVLVGDYDEAIDYFTGTLGFRLIQDLALGVGGKRWVLVAPVGSVECRLLLARAETPEQSAAVGNQAGGRVFLFLHTDDFWRDFRTLTARGVNFCEEPRTEEYGTVAVFTGLYGNRWDLLELRKG